MIKVERWLNHDIRFVSNGNEWQAIAKDIADALEYSTNNRMLERIERKYQDSYLITDEDISKFKKCTETVYILKILVIVTTQH